MNIFKPWTWLPKKKPSILSKVCNLSKVEGMYLSEFMTQVVVPLLIKDLNKDEVYVMLYDIDPGCRDADFWSNMPKTYSVKFKEDVVFLKCSSVREAETIASSLNPSFAQALVITNEANL